MAEINPLPCKGDKFKGAFRKKTQSKSIGRKRSTRKRGSKK